MPKLGDATYANTLVIESTHENCPEISLRDRSKFFTRKDRQIEGDTFLYLFLPMGHEMKVQSNILPPPQVRDKGEIFPHNL